MSYIVIVAARWTKSLKFTLSIAVHRGGLAKNHFWLVATQKKRIGEQLSYFWNMCPEAFSWAKYKRKMFSEGKSRGPLLTRAALDFFFYFVPFFSSSPENTFQCFCSFCHVAWNWPLNKEIKLFRIHRLLSGRDMQQSLLSFDVASQYISYKQDMREPIRYVLDQT